MIDVGIEKICVDYDNEDVIVEESTEKVEGTRRTGRAYRRKMRRKHIREYRNRHSFTRVYMTPCPNWEYVDGEYIMIGSHIDYPQNSKAKTFFKRVSNKKVRRHKEILPKGNCYRKVFDYWWTLS